MSNIIQGILNTIDHLKTNDFITMRIGKDSKNSVNNSGNPSEAMVADMISDTLNSNNLEREKFVNMNFLYRGNDSKSPDLLSYFEAIEVKHLQFAQWSGEYQFNTSPPKEILTLDDNITTACRKQLIEHFPDQQANLIYVIVGTDKINKIHRCRRIIITEAKLFAAPPERYKFAHDRIREIIKNDQELKQMGYTVHVTEKQIFIKNIDALNNTKQRYRVFIHANNFARMFRDIYKKEKVGFELLCLLSNETFNRYEESKFLQADKLNNLSVEDVVVKSPIDLSDIECKLVLIRK